MGGRGDGSGLKGKRKKKSEAYREFPDKASYSHGYEGDGSEQVAFFKEHSNFDELIKSMDSDERDVFQAWANGSFMWGQQYNGWDNMTSLDQHRTRVLDKFLDQATLDAGVVLVRRTDAQLVLGKGRKTGTLEELQAAEGSIVTSAGSMSFGAASQGLTIGDSRKRIEYRLSIPGGTTGAGMWIGDHRINRHFGPEQREFVTNRDVAYRVGKTRYDADRDVYVVDIQFEARLEHDYGKRGR